MSSDPGEGLERGFPYRSGWRVLGCGMVLFGGLGAGALALVPFGYEQLRNGQMPIGVAMMVVGAFGAPMIVMALMTLFAGIRDRFRPPLLRVTASSILLPKRLQGDPALDKDEAGQDLTVPPQPEEIPFTAIRWARREGPINPGSHRLVIAHDLASTTLVIEQHMMPWGDFDELDKVLRAALPAAFAAAPPVT
jgi:hypothetical protein